MKKLSLLIVLMYSCAIVLTGCGLKGDLYIPDESTPLQAQEEAR